METTTAKPYVIREVPGKGKGLIATTKIRKGTRILSEAPLFKLASTQMPQNLLEALILAELHNLTKDQKRAYVALHNSYGQETGVKPIVGIAKTNVLIFNPHKPEGGLFLDMSRVNHACRPNAHYSWNERTGRLTVHALRDVEDRQEITVSYITQGKPRQARQEFLRDCFFFDCACELCSLPPVERDMSDLRLLEVAVIEDQLGRGSGSFHYGRALALLWEMFRVLEVEGVWDQSIPKAYFVAFQIACMYGDETRARVFAERALEARVSMEGEDSPEVVRLRGYVEHPSLLASWQLRAKCPDGLVPPPLMEGEVDDWLWGDMTPEAAVGG
ncbi:hypothetical protein QBC41DRAFT_268860 [Cercophora samala]|uniref:SET domain-containing protein n=1 Tax=Cercophora samala TaxID=330535 RepID=A0AA40DFV4_9PEZI|nr:hypothetical protein QBC41DRAFT_268860 [Cercophora samala]